MSETEGPTRPPTPQMPPAPPPSAPSPAEPASGRSRTGLIVLALVLVALLGCGCVVAGAFMLFAPATSEVSTGETVSSAPSTGGDAERLTEWLAWSPSARTMLEPAPAEKNALVSEAVALLAPGFRVEETTWDPGWYDAAEEWYYGDLFIVRATHPASDAVSAGIEFTVQSDAMVAEDIPFDLEDSASTIDTLAGGEREMISLGPWEPDGLALDSADGAALWQTLGEEWPDAVVMRITPDAADPRLVEISLTKWRLYAISTYSPRVWAYYRLDSGVWELTHWEYELPSEMPTEPELPAI
ncbi:MAG: hypothetical protein Kow0067_19360 [Coriobacteriia bacterium]